MATQPITFKSALPSLTLLKIESSDSEQLQKALMNKTRQSPMMFVGMQVVIDISSLNDESLLDMADVRKILTTVGINPVAVMSDKKTSRQMAIDAGMGALPVLRLSTEKNPIIETAVKVDVTPEVADKPDGTPVSSADTMPEVSVPSGNQIIRRPVRSGQRIYAQGDLTILGIVSPGAEVIADGNIHIYGALKGRAAAGAQGDESAQIFCQHFDPELVSIAGNYKQLDEITDEYRGQRVQISLEGEKITFSLL